MSSALIRRTSHGDQYAYELSAVLQHGQRIWDPSYALSKDPAIWEKAQEDAVVSGAIERALIAIAGHDWGLQPGGDSPADKALASILEEVLREIPRFFESRRNLAEARFLGSAFAKINGQFRDDRFHDGKRRTWWVPGRLVDMDRRRFRARAVQKDPGFSAFDFQWELWSPARDQWEVVDPRMPLVKHVYADNESRLGYGRGVMDSIYYATYIRSVVQKDALQGLSRWAQGLLVATVNLQNKGATNQTTADIADEIKSELLEMVGDNVLVLGEGDTVEVHQGGGEGYQMVDKMLDRVERELITRIEGTPLSSMDGEGGGAYALGKEHGGRENAQRRFDRESLAESLSAVVEYVFNMNRAALASIDKNLLLARLPRFDIREEKVEDPRLNAEVVQIAQQVGAEISKREFYERIGWSQPDEGEETLAPPQPDPMMGGGMPGAFPGDAGGMPDASGGQPGGFPGQNGEIGQRIKSLLGGGGDQPEAAAADAEMVFPHAAQEAIARGSCLVHGVVNGMAWAWVEGREPAGAVAEVYYEPEEVRAHLTSSQHYGPWHRTKGAGVLWG